MQCILIRNSTRCWLCSLTSIWIWPTLLWKCITTYALWQLVHRKSSSEVASTLLWLISELIEQVFSLQYTLTRSHLKAWPGSMCAVTENQVRWSYSFVRPLIGRLGAHAFWTMLSPKQTGYRRTVGWLKGIVESTNCGRLQRAMERVARKHSISRRVKY